MSTHDPSRSNPPARRRVLRKIAKPAQAEAIPVLPPPPDEVLVLPKAVKPVSRPTPLPPAPAKSTYSSVAPVVATVITPLSTVLQPPGAARGASWKGVIGGTVLGLAVVGAFVVGARMAQAPASGATAATHAAPPAVTPLPAIAAATTAAAAPAALPESSPPVIAATALPLAPRPARWNPPVAAPRAPTAPPVAAPPPPAASVAQASPAPDDSAPSLVPVIPASAPPAGDPLVKAVQNDIAEEQQERGK